MPLHRIFAAILLCGVPLAFAVIAFAHPGHDHATTAEGGLKDHTEPTPVSAPPARSGSSRAAILVMSLTVFVLAIFIGFEIIAKVPPTLHTPLMSGSNAISGITVVGAIIVTGFHRTDFATWMGFIAVVLANINVVGGFVVTHRMLLMFKRR